MKTEGSLQSKARARLPARDFVAGRLVPQGNRIKIFCKFHERST